jgi:hypothetical protein
MRQSVPTHGVFLIEDEDCIEGEDRIAFVLEKLQRTLPSSFNPERDRLFTTIERDLIARQTRVAWRIEYVETDKE